MKNKITISGFLLALFMSFSISPLAHADGEIEKVNAVIESVLLAKQSVKLMHDPVEAWGWPKMKMKFSVMPNIDLSGYTPGQAVVVTLKKDGMMAMVIAIEAAQ